MYELERSLSRIRSTSCRVALQQNRRTEIGFCCVVRVLAYRGLTIQSLLAAIPGRNTKKSGSTTAFTVVAMEKKYPFRTSEYFASVVQRS